MNEDDKLTLTPAEIEELTGKVYPAVQMRELRRMGIRCERRTNCTKRPVLVVREWLTLPKEKPAPRPAKKRLLD